jgi:TRAP-type mannitol/chloroaromatic compound transport system substrate-binding protein
MAEETTKMARIPTAVYNMLAERADKKGASIGTIIEELVNNETPDPNLEIYDIIHQTAKKVSSDTAIMVSQAFDRFPKEMQKLINKTIEQVKETQQTNNIVKVDSTQTQTAKPKPEKVKELSKMLKIILETVDPTCRKLDQVLNQVKKLVDQADEHNKQVSEDKKTMILALGYARAVISFLKKNGETVYITETAEEIEQSEGEK